MNNFGLKINPGNMKALKDTYFLFLILLTFGCKQYTNGVTESVSRQANLSAQEQVELELQKQGRAKAILDSLKLDSVLQEAVKIAVQYAENKKFKRAYEVMLDSVENTIVEVIIDLDHHFTKETAHLIIHRNDRNAVLIDIYSTNNQQFEKVLSHEQWIMTYVKDTIQDINGDRRNDFVVDWYGAAGCCLKGFSNIYLLRPDQKSFSKDFEFINPTFSPKEQVIRGVCYGHPGETELYKYKWNGEQVDTLEYVYYEKNEKGKTGKVIVSNRLQTESKHKILKRLNETPIEYRKIEGYTWFTGDL